MVDAWDQFPDPPKPQAESDPWAQFPDHSLSWADVPGQAIANLPASALGVAEGIANTVMHPIFCTMCSLIAFANPYPSKVLVPLPSSSIIIRLRFVEVRRIDDASSISAMKVDIPRSWASPAPTRARM